jgi:hypothetical protein
VNSIAKNSLAEIGKSTMWFIPPLHMADHTSRHGDQRKVLSALGNGGRREIYTNMHHDPGYTIIHQLVHACIHSNYLIESMQWQHA